METERLTREIIRFALHTKYEEIPDNVIQTQKKCLLDSIGVMTAASGMEPACRPFLDFAAENSGEAACTVFGTDRKASVLMASMANGALIHALDYEDGHDASKCHSNTASIPVLLALGESLKKSGREVLAAMVVSSEIAIRLKLALTANDLTDCGFYSPPMFSAYGAVLGAARLLELDEEAALDALSICLTQVMLPGQSARSKQSVLRGVRDAFSARAAAFGALLAQKGVRARLDEPLEGVFGLYMCCFRGNYDPDVILNGLGTHWESGRLRFKPWPCCGTSHAVIDAILTLRSEHALTMQEVQRIHLIVNRPHLNLLEPRDVKYRPGSLAAAKFSLPFAAALAVKYGRVTFDLYCEAALHDAQLLRLADLVSYEQRPVEEGRPAAFYGDDHVEVILTTTRGELRREIFDSCGSPGRPLSAEQLHEKFFDCMAHGAKPYAHSQAKAVLDAVLSLETIPSVEQLCCLL